MFNMQKYQMNLVIMIQKILNLYISSYNKDDIEVIVKEIENDEEYNIIKTEINKILLTIKNESDKLD